MKNGFHLVLFWNRHRNYAIINNCSMKIPEIIWFGLRIRFSIFGYSLSKAVFIMANIFLKQLCFSQ